MGCDIHCYREKLIDGKWVTADEWVDNDVDWEKRFTERNYSMFGLIADRVRESFPFSVEARGLPSDVSPEVKDCSDRWNCDGHSHSYLTKQEMVNLKERIDGEFITVSGMKDAEGWKKYKASVEIGTPDYELIYPFCKYTNAEGYVPFETKIPASFMIGESLKRLIAVLDHVDGDDQRIVFWFDN